MARYYSAIVVLAVLLLAGGLALFNYKVDPYSAYHLKDISTSSDTLYYFRLIKAQQLRHAPGDLLILGSSRIATIRPQLPAGEGYNASLPGMTPQEMYASLVHANSFTPTRRLLVGLDFSAFLDRHPKTRFGFSDARLADGPGVTPGLAELQQYLHDSHGLLLSVQTTGASLHSVLGTKKGQLDYYADGTWNTNPAFLNMKRQQRFFKIGKQYNEIGRESSQQHDLHALRQLIRYCHEHDIEAKFFISPVHVLTLAAYREAGQLQHMLRWQRAVLDALEREAAAANRPAFPLYGFQNFAEATSEAMNSGLENALFIDAIHYSYRFGDLIREEALGLSHEHAVLLDDSIIESYWQEVLSRLRAFERANPTIMKQFKKALAGD